MMANNLFNRNKVEKSRVESYLFAEWTEERAYLDQIFKTMNRSLSPSGRFLIHQYSKKKPIVHDLIYQQKMELNYISRFESNLNNIIGPLHFIDERFVLFINLDEDGKSIVTLAELQLEKQEIYIWDSVKMNQKADYPTECAIVVGRENPMENIFVMTMDYREILFDLTLENTTEGPQICKSSLQSGHQLFHRLENRMFDGQKIYGFPWKPTTYGSRLDRTELISCDLKTKTSEIIQLEGLKQLADGHQYDREVYQTTSLDCWMGNRFFGVFTPEKLRSSGLNKATQVIFCMDLNTRKWQSTSFAFNKQIRQLSVANDQLIVETENGCYSLEHEPIIEVISCYRLPIKCPTSLQKIVFYKNKRYLEKNSELAKKFEGFLLPEEFRKIDFNEY